MLGRREFLRDAGALALVTAAGGLVTTATTISTAAASSTTLWEVAGFGWDASVSSDGLDIYFEVVNDMIIQVIDIDLSYMITSIPSEAQITEVLYYGTLTPGGPPDISLTGPPYLAYITTSSNSDFGNVYLNNPSDLTTSGVTTATSGTVPVAELVFFSAKLKAFVPATSGTGAQAFRHLHLTPLLAANVGDYLALHMNGAGQPVDSEVQCTLNYQLT